MIKELPQQFHAVLGESFHITCIATNDQDAPVNLIFYWGDQMVFSLMLQQLMRMVV